MSLNPISSADDQYRIVKNLQCPLHLRRKVHMTRRVEEVSQKYRPTERPPASEKIVMPRARSSAKVSRKASRLSTRPIFFSFPVSYKIASDIVVFPASTCARIPIHKSFHIVSPLSKNFHNGPPDQYLDTVYQKKEPHATIQWRIIGLT